MGPEPKTNGERWQLAGELCRRVRRAHGVHVMGVALYGSMARGDAHPLSDLEFRVAVDAPLAGHEFVWKGFKVEVDVEILETILREAASVDGEWPLWGGMYRDLVSLYDRGGIWAQVAHAARSLKEHQFQDAAREVVVGDLYEIMGKLRQALRVGHVGFVPQAAMQLAWGSARLVGLLNRTPYGSAVHVLTRSCTLPRRPAGHDALVGRILHGALAPGWAVAQDCERLWQGVAQLMAAEGLALAEDVLPWP